MGRYKLAIIIPAFNEENTIFDVVQSVKNHGIAIVVNDASTDKTEKIAESAGAVLINHKENKGYNFALISGFKMAEKLNCEGVVTFDADGQHSASLLIDYIKYLNNGYDLVLGTRPNFARVSEWFFMLYTRKKFGWKDPLCGMKGYSMNIYKNQGFFDSFGSINTQLATFGLFHGYSFIQVPIPIMERKDRPRFSSTIVSNFHIIFALIKTIKNVKRMSK